MASTVAATFPNFSRYITTFDAQGKTVYVNTPNPPPSFAPNAKSRVDYIYSAPASASGPLLADDVDLKEHQVVAAKPPYVLFPGPNGSSCIIGNYVPNPSGEPGVMHRSNTLDYIFILDGELELTLDSGEKRVLTRGDTVVQRAAVHAWKNLSKTESARIAAVCIGTKDAVVNEVIPAAEEK